MSILIKNGIVLDFRSQEWKKLNILLKNEEIIYVGKEVPQADDILDASGNLITPGFIDIHMHGEKISDDSTSQALLLQGVTTVLSGNCGVGYCSLEEETAQRTKQGVYQNWLSQVGHGFLREQAGVVDRYGKANTAEIIRMQELLRFNLNYGAKGVSFGLEYTPGATTKEVTEITNVLADYPGTLASFHIRYDTHRVEEAIREVIAIARHTGVSIQISHLGSMAGFGKIDRVLEIITEAVNEGLDIMIDCYPYPAFATSIGSAVFDEGFIERFGVGYEALEIASGKYKGIELNPELFATIRQEAPDSVVIAKVMKAEDVWLCLKHPLTMLGSDGGLRFGEGHPRAAGAFVKFLRLVRDEQILPLKDALSKMIDLPANRLGIQHNRGRIHPGFKADLVVFNFQEISDQATFSQPNLPPTGIKWVLVNGQVAAENGKLTGVKNGRFLLNNN